MVASDERFRLLAGPVADAIAEDRAAGLTPLAIAAVAGSTNTGSVDDVRRLADLAEREGLWLHVDAAYGGAARLSPRDAHRVPGLERADCVTVDPHKWFFQAYDIGALSCAGARTCSTRSIGRPSTTARTAPRTSRCIGTSTRIEGTRRFRALKLWMSWKHLGTEGLGRLVEHNDDLAAYLAADASRPTDFERRLRAGAVRRVLPPPAGGSTRCRRRRARRLPERACSARWRSTAPPGSASRRFAATRTCAPGS